MIVSFLLERLPESTHLVISSRVDPPLPLARLRARGQMRHAADLRFTPEEAAAFLGDVMGLDLSADDVAALEGVTEGWIAALQLAALSMRERKDVSGFIRSFSGGHRDVFDFLAEEVLERQNEQVQAFLLETSVLYSLSGPLCDALTGRNDGQHTLEAGEGELTGRSAGRRAGLVPLPSPLRRVLARSPRARAARAARAVAPEGFGMVRGERTGRRGSQAFTLGRRSRTRCAAGRAGDRSNLVPRRGGDFAGLASRVARRGDAQPPAAVGVVRCDADAGRPVKGRVLPTGGCRGRDRRGRGRT